MSQCQESICCSFMCNSLRDILEKLMFKFQQHVPIKISSHLPTFQREKRDMPPFLYQSVLPGHMRALKASLHMLKALLHLLRLCFSNLSRSIFTTKNRCVLSVDDMSVNSYLPYNNLLSTVPNEPNPEPVEWQNVHCMAPSLKPCTRDMCSPTYPEIYL